MYFFFSALIILIDRLTKVYIVQNMQVGECRNLTNFLCGLDLNYVQNNGAAFSILQGKQAFLIIFTILIMIGIIAYLISFRKKISKLESFSLALILGGGIGNLTDRLVLNYVIDFINIHLLPVFNFADIAITCGCILFILSILFSKNDEQRDN